MARSKQSKRTSKKSGKKDPDERLTKTERKVILASMGDDTSGLTPEELHRRNIREIMAKQDVTRVEAEALFDEEEHERYEASDLDDDSGNSVMSAEDIERIERDLDNGRIDTDTPWDDD